MKREEKKHLHMIYLSNECWEIIKSYSIKNNLRKSEALQCLLLKEDEALKADKALKDNKATSYDDLMESLDLIKNALSALKPPEPIAFGEIAQLYLDEQRRQNKSSTVRTHKAPLNARILDKFGDRMIGDIKRQELSDYIESLQGEGLSPSYINQILGTIKQIFSLAKTNGFIKDDVSETVKRLPEPKSNARSTTHRALDKAGELKYFLDELVFEHLYLFIMFMLYTGLRHGECSALTADDISFDEEYIYIKRTMITDENNHVVMGDSPKTKSSVRKIPMNDKLKEILLHIEMPSDGSTIFKSAQGKVVSNSAVNRAIKNTIKRVSEKHGVLIQPFTSHALRDTFATYYAEANADKGGDVKTLQELLGHARMSITTDLYMHALDENKVKGMKRVEGMFK